MLSQHELKISSNIIEGIIDRKNFNRASLASKGDPNDILNLKGDTNEADKFTILDNFWEYSGSLYTY